jgi:type IV secretion system protein VirD4
MSPITTLILVSAVMFTVLGLISLLAHIYNLNNIKAKTVGDGQHGTARFATKAEVRKTYLQVPYTPELWRKQKGESNNLPQGIVVGCNSSKLGTTALVDEGDVHCLMIGAAGVGKMAYFLYPNLGATRS